MLKTDMNKRLWQYEVSDDILSNSELGSLFLEYMEHDFKFFFLNQQKRYNKLSIEIIRYIITLIRIHNNRNNNTQT